MMSWLHRTLARAAALFRTRRIDRELEEDLATHIELLTDEYVAKGLNRQAARREARLRFGSVDSAMELHRDVRSLRWVETAALDVRYGVRALLHDRAAGVVSVFTMSVALALATVTLAVLEITLLRPLPYDNADQVFGIEIERREGSRILRPSASLADMRRAQATGAVSVAAGWNDVPFGCISYAAVPVRVEARLVTESYLALHGTQPARGRDFSAADMNDAAPLVALLGHAFWRTHLDSAEVIGTSIRCGAQVATVVGVLPPGLYPSVAIWLPLRVTGLQAERRGAGVTVHGRLAPDVTRSEAEARLARALPAGPSGGTTADGQANVRLRPVLENTISRYRATTNVLAGGMLLVLALAVVNVSGLFLTRTAARRRELAVRLAIGATHARLVRQLLLEAVVLTTVSAAIGAFIAWLVVDAVVGILPIALPDAAPLSVNMGVLATVAVLAIVLGLSIGAIASVNLVLHDAQRELGASSATLRGRLPRRTAQLLIASEVALALVLAAAGGSLIRSYGRLMDVDLGFDPSGVVAFNVAPVDVGADAKLQFYSQVAERVALLPAVEAVGLVDHFPLGESSIGVSASAGGESVGVGFRQIMAGYFAALGVRAMQGHLPDGQGPHDQSAAVINESAARRLFDTQALGSSFSIGKRTFRVSGVVPDFVHGGPLKKASPEVFVPFDPTDSRSRILHSMTVVLRTRASGRASSDSIGQVIRGIGPAAVVEEIRTADGWLADRVAIPRHRAILFVLLAAVGLLLMGVLVFSTTGYAVAGRSGEIALRIALGAHPAAVVRRTLVEAGWPVLWGVGAGLGLIYLSSQTLRSHLYEISPTDAGTIPAVAIIVVGLALLAAWIPARRVIHLDPVAALRQD